MVLPLFPLFFGLLSSAIWGLYFQDMRVFLAVLLTYVALWTLFMNIAATTIHHLWWHMSGHNDEDY